MQVHIEAESKAAYHCRKYTIGDEDCDHTHTEVCQQCLNLEEILDERLWKTQARKIKMLCFFR